MLTAVASARRASRSATERLHLVCTAHLQTLLDEIEGATAHLQIDALPPAMRDANASALKRLILRMPERPAISACQFFSTPVPKGVTRPRPVTTTLRGSVVFTMLNQSLMDLGLQDKGEFPVNQ